MTSANVSQILVVEVLRGSSSDALRMTGFLFSLETIRMTAPDLLRGLEEAGADSVG
jgi:hypothetical protein